VSHLTGCHEQLVGHDDAERLAGLDIDDELEFGRLLGLGLAVAWPAAK
jgi:hypothetical protein